MCAQLKDVLGEPLFETISICLVCEDCMKTDHPEKCTHKMAEMPRWLSSRKMETVCLAIPCCLHTVILMTMFLCCAGETTSCRRPGTKQAPFYASSKQAILLHFSLLP